MAMTEVERELEIENRRAIRTAKLQQFNLEQRIRQKKKKEKEAAKAKKAGGRRKSTRAQSKKTLSRKAALDNLLAKKKALESIKNVGFFRGRNGNFVCFR